MHANHVDGLVQAGQCDGLQQMGSNLLIYVWYCISSCASTIILILQDSHHPASRPQHLFYHPLMQTQMMVVGMSLCFLTHLILTRTRADRTSMAEAKPAAPVLVCIVPLLMDLFASSLELISLNYVAGSVYSIANCLVVVSTAFFSRVMLGTRFNLAQMMGCALTVAGVVVAGVGESLGGDSEEDQSSLAFGVVVMLVAFVVEGVEMVVVEKIYAKYSITPMRLVGISGVAGTIIWSCVLTVLTFVGCPFDPAHCVEDAASNCHLEHVPTFFADLRGDTFLIVMVVVKIFVVARYNYDTSTVVAKSSAMVLVIITIFSNGLTWLVGILITVIGAGNDELQIEKLDPVVNAVKAVGFVVTTLGLLMYNELILKKASSNVEETGLMTEDDPSDN